MHAKPDLRVVLKWTIAGSGSVIAAVIWLDSWWPKTGMRDETQSILVAKGNVRIGWWQVLAALVSLSSRIPVLDVSVVCRSLLPWHWCTMGFLTLR